MLIPDEWEEAKMTPPPPMKSWAASILIGRTGAKSDALVSRIAEIFRLADSKIVARNEVELDALSLFADPRPIGSKPIHLKVFVRGDGAKEYGEFFLDVDIPGGHVQVKEKDPEYRQAVVKALSASAR